MTQYHLLLFLHSQYSLLLTLVSEIYVIYDGRVGDRAFNISNERCSKMLENMKRVSLINIIIQQYSATKIMKKEIQFNLANTIFKGSQDFLALLE